jgi:hypothetical protein
MKKAPQTSELEAGLGPADASNYIATTPAPRKSESTAAVARIADGFAPAIAEFARRHGLHLEMVSSGDIPGSYWGESEAGLVGDRLYVRADTPVHSALHETCHYICMDSTRRDALHTNAGGTDTEENAVCYLQVLLADELPGYSREKMFADMDAWGYNFILGSARAWFERDADDAIAWLQARGLLKR